MSEKLIECVRKYSCLYDCRNSAYKNVSAKARLWETIGAEINESGETARKKWKSLRDNYMRYKKEITGTTGQAAKKFEKWPWAAHLQFLDDTLTERERTSNVTLTRAKISPETRSEISPETASTAMPSTSSTNEPISEQGVNPTTILHPSQESLSVRSPAKKQKKKSFQ
ncbi:unnamed protein product [Euphydryas editha]|uniref:MADF domain-containing protein n=1 Tax=Euphydryas editha TaxID=104508 RepID=A0AAU9UJG2_EUPED|nr:unnamed protein product [Euphydryas editha]